MTSPPKILIASYVAFLFCNALACAQQGNPLRSDPTAFGPRQQTSSNPAANAQHQSNLSTPTLQADPLEAEIPQEIYREIYPNEHQEPHPSQPDSKRTPLRIDHQVKTISAEEENVPSNMEGFNQVLKQLSGQPGPTPEVDATPAENFGTQLKPIDNNQKDTTEKDDTKAEALKATSNSQARLGEIVEKILYNTLTVLAVGVGFIFVAKMLMKPKIGAKSNSTKSTEFNVLSNMKLAAKVNLFLVGVDDTRLVVATDPSGVKSVVRLNESFADTLGQIEPEEFDAALFNKPPESNESNAYSLSKIGETKPSAVETPIEKPENREDEIRKKMEAALAEHGLKDLLLNTLKNG